MPYCPPPSAPAPGQGIGYVVTLCSGVTTLFS